MTFLGPAQKRERFMAELEVSPHPLISFENDMMEIFRYNLAAFDSPDCPLGDLRKAFQFVKERCVLHSEAPHPRSALTAPPPSV